MCAGGVCSLFEVGANRPAFKYSSKLSGPNLSSEAPAHISTSNQCFSLPHFMLIHSTMRCTLSPYRMEAELSTHLCNDPFDQPAHCSIMQMTCLHYPIHQSTRSAFRRRRDIHRYSSSSMYRLFLSFALQAENCFLPSGSCSKRLGTSS